MTSVLEGSKFWLGYGTFKLSPKIFYQIYTLHAYVLGIAPACLYVLLLNKTEKTYGRLLDALETPEIGNFWLTYRKTLRCKKYIF